MASGSAVDTVLGGDIDWVTAHGTRPSFSDVDETHDLRVQGDFVVIPPPAGDSDALQSSAVRAATLYMAMDGITLYPDCPVTGWVHSAFDCTSLVDMPTTLPAVSSEAAKAQLVQAVQSHLAAFDVAVTTKRPPPYLPYFVAAIGGNGDWKGGNLCGQATLSCSGQRRNLVSVVFPGNPNCADITGTVVHELGHNLGLEHTSLQPDTMFTPALQQRSPQNACSSIQLGDKDAISCPSSHAQQCPEGNGTQQNTMAELLSRVGPRRHDDEPPQVSEVWPPNGSVFTTDDVIPVTARVEDEGGTLGVRWRWLEGLPPGYDSYEQCTNDVCELAFLPEAHASGRWDLVTLVRPPAGAYAFRLDTVDAHGNTAIVTIQIRVEEPGEGDDVEDGGTTGDDVATDDDSDDDELEIEDEEIDEDALPPSYGELLDAEAGCGCQSGGSAPSLAFLALITLLLVRRRRQAPDDLA